MIKNNNPKTQENKIVEIKKEKILIRVFKKDYAQEMFKIHLEEMPKNDQMTRQNFFDEFSALSRKYFVAIFQNKVVGYLGLFDCGDDENIIGIAIEKQFQNRGIGTKLIEKGASFARKNKKKSLSLEVDENNLKAISFYKKNKFVVTNVRKNYYKNSDAYIMFWYL